MCYQPNVTPGSGLGLGDLAAARGTPGDNIVVIKATYWLSVH